MSGSSSSASEASLATAPPARLGQRKVRTGCSTCKIRKVKCDEAKPHCFKCESTGRTCEYSPVVPRRKRQQPLQQINDAQQALVRIHVSPSSLTELKTQELRSLEFFQLRTIPALGRYFSSDFWDRLVLQTSRAEPAVRHAVLAVSSLHELFERNGEGIRSLTSSLEKAEFYHAVQTYGKALHLMQDRLAAGDDSLAVALISCVLFVGFESIRGNITAALTHIKNGLDILAAQRATRSGISKSSSINNLVEDELVPVYSRLSIMSSTFGQPSFQLLPQQDTTKSQTSVPMLQTFESLDKARARLLSLISLTLRFNIVSAVTRYPPYQMTTDLMNEHASIVGQVNQWKAGLDAFVDKHPESQNSETFCAIQLLKIHYTICLIWVQTCFLPGQKAFDTQLEKFESVVCMTEEVLTLSSAIDDLSNPSKYKFALDMNIIAPVYFVALKCRDPILRRRALALLSRTPQREGLWDSMEVEIAARKVIDFEEGGILAPGLSPLVAGAHRPPSTLHPSVTMPPEESRIHDAFLESSRGADGFVNTVTMMRKPYGLDAEWDTIREEFRTEHTLPFQVVD